MTFSVCPTSYELRVYIFRQRYFVTILGHCLYFYGCYLLYLSIMPTLVVCPNCSTQFEPTAAIAQSVRDELTKEYNQKWKNLASQKDEDFRQRELQWQKQQQELQRKADDEKRTLELSLRKELEQKVMADYELKMRLLEDDNRTKDSKLAEAREKEMEFLKKMQELKTKEQELEITMQRRMVEERERLTETVRKEEEERNKLHQTEYELKLKEKLRVSEPRTLVKTG